MDNLLEGCETDMAYIAHRDRRVSPYGGTITPEDFRHAVSTNLPTDFERDFRWALAHLRPDPANVRSWDRRNPWVTAPVMRLLYWEGERIEALQWRGAGEDESKVGQRVFPTEGCCECSQYIHPNEFSVEMVDTARNVLSALRGRGVRCTLGQVRVPADKTLAVLWAPRLDRHRDYVHYQLVSLPVNLVMGGELLNPEPFMSEYLRSWL